jgi:glycosyltransferase involved in cell wall biosynthesis
MLDLALAKRFAGLLHPEVRASKKTLDEANEYFAQWWLIKGRAQFSYWSYLSEAEKKWLRQAVSKIRLGQVELELPRALPLALSFRPDVKDNFAAYQSNGIADPKALVGWFFALGLQEHLLTDLIDLDLIKQLDRSVKPDDLEPIDAAGVEENGAAAADPEVESIVPAPTVLMVLIWSMLEPKLQALMDLRKAQTRFRFIAWFFANAFEVFRLEKLVANRWKSWLQEPIFLENRTDTLARFALQAHFLMKPADRPDLQTALGLQQMREWAKTQTEVKGKWHWLVDKNPPSPKLPYPRFEPAEAAKRQAPGAARKERAFGVNLIGFAYGELGIGEDLRMAVEACEAAAIPYRIVNIKPGDEIRQEDFVLKERIEKGKKVPSYAVNLFIMPGFDTISRLFMRHGDFVFQDFYNIGWWPWELPIWPKAWADAFDVVDEVWAGSAFTLQTYQSATQKPSFLMPLAVSVKRAKTYSRKHFGLPANDFLFLYVFDFNSHLMRKNPAAAIAAFEQAFAGKQAEPVQLILKVMNTRTEDPVWQAFEKRVAQNKRIRIMNQTMDREEVLGLIQVCDAYVSPHRAEGFGRTIAEAMLFGKPVIATNYSGNQFYMHPELTLPVEYQLVPIQKGEYFFVQDEDRAVWAEPSIEHLALQMQAALTQAHSPTFEEELIAYSEKTFAPERTGELMQARLQAIQASEKSFKGTLG